MAKRKKGDGDSMDDMFPQKQIPAIEEAYQTADKKRAEVESTAAALKELKTELKDLEKALRITVKSYSDQIDKQETEDQLPDLIYDRGVFNVEVKAHERMTYKPLRETPKDGE